MNENDIVIPFESKESTINSIKQAGQYLIDHADNLLGEYPSFLNEFAINIKFYRGCATIV